MTTRICFLLCCALFSTASIEAQAIRTNAGFQRDTVPRNDDGSGPLTRLGFSINFFGKIRDSVYVNNNGNVTFDSALDTFTPFGLQKTDREIIAPFFADVDTRGPRSKEVSYGQDTVNGHAAFAANYLDVGYYNAHDDKLNRFQVVIIDRSDTGPGNFNLEFNYERILWETGDASGGSKGSGGTAAVVGWANGISDDSSWYQLPGSMSSGILLDSGPNALVRARLNTSQVGRLVFLARDGVISPGLTIQGGVAPDAIVGQSYTYKFNTIGADGPVKWDLTPDIDMPTGISFSDGVLTGRPAKQGTFTFTLSAKATVEAEDVTVFQRGSLTVAIPKLTLTTGCPLPGGSVGTPYMASFTTQSAISDVVWSVDNPYSLPSGMRLFSSGLLAGVPLLPGTFGFNLRVQSADGSATQAAGMSCHVTIVPTELRLASGCALNATRGVPYLQTLKMDGGVGPYRFSLVGQLPLGLGLTEDGSISGIPLVASYYPFDVIATDARGKSLTQSCTILSSDPAIAVTSVCPLPDATTGSPYSAALSAQGGSSPYVWAVASGVLPPGLVLSSDGRIVGTPMATGAHGFRLVVADAAGNQAGAGCSLSVRRGPLGIGSCPLPEATAGDAYSLQLSPAGGTEPYSWWVDGTLPPGLSLSGSGIVAGTVTGPGDFQFSLGLRDGSQNSIVQACSMGVRPMPLQVTTSCPVSPATVGQRYSIHFGAVGGTPPYQFDSFGYLPPGMSITSDGMLVGTPLTVGKSSFGLRVLDANGAATQSLCSLEVGIPPVPKLSIGLPSTVSPASRLQVGVQLDRPYNLQIMGRLSMAVSTDTHSPVGNANQPDPHVRFLDGQSTNNFTIPPGTTSVQVPLLSTGTVASTATVSIGSLRIAATDQSLPVVPQTFRVPASPPLITSGCFEKRQSGILLTVIGSTTTRELVSAEVSAGSAVGTTSLSSIASGYFASDASIRFGGAFMLQFGADASLAASAGPFKVRLSNTEGWSPAVVAQPCP